MTGLQKLTEGQAFTVKNVSLNQKWTEPPQSTPKQMSWPRWKNSAWYTCNESRIIERLVETEVVERQSGRFHPTKKGKQLIDLVNDELKSPELTAKWEQELEQNFQGKSGSKSLFTKNSPSN